MHRAFAAAALVLGSASAPVFAVDAVRAADVSTKSFSVVWVDDEPLEAVAVRVYADANGTLELTSGLTQVAVSAAVAGAHALGIAKVDVSGLAADTCYFYETETTTASGIEAFPSAPPFSQVCTAQSVTKILPGLQPIANDAIRHDVPHPDGVSSSSGILVLLEAPGAGAYPVSAFVGASGSAPRAVLDLNNLYDGATGDLLQVDAGAILRMVELRGLACPDPTEQQRTRYARAPEHEEAVPIGVPIVEIESADACFFVDTECDDTIDILDAQRVLNAFGGAEGDCRFNPDLDAIADRVINVLDVQSVLNRLGESAPFQP